MWLKTAVMSYRVRNCRLVPGDLVLDCSETGLQFGEMPQGRNAMRSEHFAPRVVGRVALRAKVGKRLYRGYRHTCRLQAHDELQPVQIGRRVQPMPSGSPSNRAQQARLLVITQGMRGNTSGCGHLADS